MKVFKKIGKAVKSVVKGVKKVFKEVTDSKIGKALLVGAAVFLGGAALGFWNVPQWVPFSSNINGAFTSNAASVATTGEATATSSLASGVGPTTGPGFSAGGMTSTATLPSATPASGFTLAGQTATTMPTVSAGGGGSFAVNSGASKGLIGKIGDGAKAVGNFINENPVVSMMGMNAMASMAAPDEIDMLNEQKKLLDDDRDRREANLDVRGINFNFSPQRQPLTFLSTGQPIYGAKSGLIGPKVMG